MKNTESFLNDEIGPLLEHPKNTDKTESNIPFKLVSDFSPAGDQPQAIKELVTGINNGERSQVLLGVTGSGKTFTMAQVIQEKILEKLKEILLFHFLKRNKILIILFMTILLPLNLIYNGILEEYLEKTLMY